MFARIGPLQDRVCNGIQYYRGESGYNFTMKKLLIVGCGDIALRALPQLVRSYQVFALVRAAGQVDRISAFGAKPVAGDLDSAATLAALAGVADLVLHLAPPDDSGERDQRTANLIAALSPRPPERPLYI